MRKIAFISTESNISGATLAMLEIMNELKSRGYECICITAERGEIENRLAASGFRYYKARFGSWLVHDGELSTVKGWLKNFLKRLLDEYSELVITSVLKKENPDILHINTGFSHVGLRSAKRLGIPVVWHLREDPVEYWNRRPYNAEFEKKCLLSADKLIAISKYVKGLYVGKSSDNLMYIYDGVDVTGYPGMRTEEILSRKSVNMTLCGSTEEKGHTDAIRAAAKLVETGFTDFTINFYGNIAGDYRKQLEALCSELHVEDYIVFRGMTNQMNHIWSSTDIALVCSRAECFGRAAVEAMSGGALVIGANRGATPELIEDSRGLLYEYGNPDDLCEKILCAVNDVESSRALAKNGNDYALSCFSLDDYTSQLCDVYESILKDEVHI